MKFKIEMGVVGSIFEPHPLEIILSLEAFKMILLYLIKISLTERLWQYHPKWKQPKWKFSTFCGLPGTTSYPYLPLRTIDPPDTRSHPQGGVQIYPQPNHLSKKGKKSTSPQIAISLKIAS